MSRISDVSSKLGEYMLKGYILTDEGCPACSIPMLRTPSGQSPQQLFCSQCNSPSNAHASSSHSSSTEEPSGVSTPPTELFSSGLSSPALVPIDTAEIARRRAQSDMASAEIGRRMLKGWAMLAEECPNNACYGVPLLRPPRSGGEKDPRKECVVCHKVYIFQQNEFGQNVLVQSTPSVAVQPDQGRANESRRVQHDNASSPSSSRLHHNDDEKQPVTESPRTASSAIYTLSRTIDSLEQTLEALARRIVGLSQQTPIDHIKIGEVAATIEQVTNALRTASLLNSRLS